MGETYVITSAPCDLAITPSQKQYSNNQSMKQIKERITKNS